MENLATISVTYIFSKEINELDFLSVWLAKEKSL